MVGLEIESRRFEVTPPKTILWPCLTLVSKNFGTASWARSGLLQAKKSPVVRVRQLFESEAALSCIALGTLEGGLMGWGWKFGRASPPPPPRRGLDPGWI